MKLITKPLGCLFSILVALVLLLIIVGVIVLWAAGRWGPAIAVDAIQTRTGFPTSIESYNVNLFKGVVEIHDLEIKNPDRFPDPDFIDLREFSAYTSLANLRKDPIVIDRLVIDIDTVGFVQSRTDGNNLKAFTEGLAGDKKEQDTKAEEGKEPPAYLIKELVIRLNTVKYTNQALPTPIHQEIPIRIDRTFTDVRDIPTQVVQPLIKDFGTAGLNFLSTALLDSMQDFGEYREAAEKLIQENAALIQQGQQQLQQQGQQLLEEGSKAVEELGGSLRDLFNRRSSDNE